MSGPDAGPAPDPAVRRAWRIAGWGTLVVGGGLAAASAAGGGSGRQGLAALLFGALLGTAGGALYAVATGIRDTLRGQRVGRRRAIVAAVLGLLALILPAMLVGVAAA